MVRKTPRSTVIPMPLRPAQLMGLIRSLAKERQVFFSKHAFERQEERSCINEITQADVFRVLELGSMEGVPIQGAKKNEWKATIVFRPKGSRGIGVATVLVDNLQKLLVTTVMWRDR